VKNLKSVNEDRAKMVRQRNTGRFLQAVAELNEVAPPPDSLAQELENAPGKKGKKGKKRKKGEAATAATNDAAKKAKTEKPAGKKAKNQNAKKAALSRTKKSSTSTQDGDVSGPSGEKNEAVSSFEISQSETDGDKVFTTESKQYHKYGFIGLGSMGYGIAANLLKAGFNVTVWNRTMAKVDELAAKGARKGESAAAVASRCNVTFACLSTPEICKEVVLGPQGIINGISSGKGYVDMSTIDPETSKELEQAVIAAGGRYLEAPVLGSIDAVTSGQLIVMAAGNPALFDEVRSAFDAISTKSYFLGETGNASRMKLVNNTMINGVTASLAESMALAKKCGVSQREFYEILTYGPLSSRQVKNKGLAILEGKFSALFTVEMMQKDMRLALALAKQHGQRMPVTAASNEVSLQFHKQSNKHNVDLLLSSLF
jgi:glyoxylate/succinic semialdehyde reductase